MGKSTINGPFSIAMLNYQRVVLLAISQDSKPWLERTLLKLVE
jgi:hypothetical protein